MTGEMQGTDRRADDRRANDPQAGDRQAQPRGAGRHGAMRGLLLAGVAGMVLAGCDTREVILPGEREDLRAVMSDQQPGDVTEAPQDRSAPIALPAAQANAEWTQRAGTPATRVAHPALGAQPQRIFSTGIGQGDQRKARITADPVVGGGRVFTLDSEATVSAVSPSGELLWQTSLVPPQDNGGDASGGGLAYGRGKLYVASAFGTLTALDPATGGQVWQQDLGMTGNASPTVHDDLVYLVAGDRLGMALDAETGRIRWQVNAAPDVNNINGGPAPAVTDTYAVFGFGSGVVQGTFRQGGLARWNTPVVGRRFGFARANVGDITGDPVVVGDTVYVSNNSGRLAALSIDDGDARWTAKEGAASAVWPAGGSLFVISDRNELLRLDAATGERIWGTELPFFVKSRARKQKEIFAHHGPIVAGGRVIVASNDGLIRFYDPVSGAETGGLEVPGGATTAPVVAGGTLYVVSAKGVLHAWR